MELTVIKFNDELRSCCARTNNEILVVIPLLEDHPIGLGDKLTIRDFRMDAKVSVCHNACKREFRVYIHSNDVHDLRVRMRHGAREHRHPRGLALSDQSPELPRHEEKATNIRARPGSSINRLAQV